jgi:hypothetical protein
MDVEIKELSLTILVGVAFIASVVLSIRLTLNRTFTIKLPHLFKIETENGSAPPKTEEILTFAHNVALVVVFLGIGIFLQDYSKSIVAQRSQPIAIAISPIDIFVELTLPATETTSRLEPFFSERQLVKNRVRSPQRELAAICDNYFRSRRPSLDVDRTIPADMPISAFAHRMFPRLKDSTDKPSLRGLGKMLVVTGNLEDKSGPIKCSDLMLIEDLYYRAKNIVFQNANYFAELQSIEGKLNFLRGMTFVAAASWVFYSGLVLTAFAKWIFVKLGKWKTIRARGVNSRLPHIGWLLFLVVADYSFNNAYRTEELNFNNRVFGYFEVMCLLSADCVSAL